MKEKEQRENGRMKKLLMHSICIGTLSAEERKRFLHKGEVPALERKRRRLPPVEAKVDGATEAHR